VGKDKGESYSKLRLTRGVRGVGDEDDTQGHSKARGGDEFSPVRSKARGGDEFSPVRSKARATEDEDDTEGHRMPSPRSPSSRGE
jgi:hypothetical protein